MSSLRSAMGTKAKEIFSHSAMDYTGSFNRQLCILYQEWLVLKIAECMWRLRRAARCESGSVREAMIWDRQP